VPRPYRHYCGRGRIDGCEAFVLVFCTPITTVLTCSPDSIVVGGGGCVTIVGSYCDNLMAFVLL
jgi:hypothetical protein